MAFKVKILNIDKVLKKIEDLFSDDVYKNNKLKTDIGEFSTLRIQAETRKGNQLPGSERAGDTKQRPLSEAYKSFRRDLIGAEIPTETDSWWFDPDTTFFKPDKSNLTATGQLLESLRFRVSNLNGEIIIAPTGTRDRKRQSPKADKFIETNVELAKQLAYRKRFFLGLDEYGVKRIKKMILDEVRRFKRRRGFK